MLRPPALLQGVRIGRPVERQHVGDAMLQATRAQRLVDGVDGAADRRLAHRVDENRRERDVLRHHCQQGQGRAPVAVRCIGDDLAARHQHADVAIDVGAEVDLDDALEGFLLRKPHPGGVFERRHRQVDHRIGTGSTHDIGDGRIAHAGRHQRRTGQLRPLHRIEADRPRAALHQHPPADYAAMQRHGAVRGHRRDAQTGAFGEADAVRQKYGARRRQRHPLRGTAEGAVPLRLVTPDALTDTRRIDPLADLGNDAGRILMRHDALEGHRLTAPRRAPLDVGWIDRAGENLDQHLARPGHRQRQATELQHLVRRALPLVPDGLHHRGAPGSSSTRTDNVNPAAKNSRVCGSRMCVASASAFWKASSSRKSSGAVSAR
jgi:hypothetical protein